MELNPANISVAAAAPGENNWWPAVIFGSSLVLLATGMMTAHWRSWKRQTADPDATDADQVHYANRFRRRMQTSGMIALTGILVALGDVFIWQFGAPTATVFWMITLLLVCWIAVLAIGDMTAIQSHSKNQLADLEAHRRILEQELAEIRARSNGSDRNGNRSGKSP